MGLDIVEFVMEVEEEFKVSISDREAERILTVGQLHAWLVDKLRAIPTGRCLSSACFYRLRRTLMALFQIPRHRIRPGTPLDDVIPVDNRRAAWVRLNQALNDALPSASVSLPPLAFPRWFWFLLMAVILACPFVTILVAMASGAERGLAAVVLFTVELALLGGMYLAIRALKRRLSLVNPLAVHFPLGCTTVREGVESMLPSEHGIRGEAARNLSESDVWTKLRAIVAYQFGIKSEEVTKATRFFDLG